MKRKILFLIFALVMIFPTVLTLSGCFGGSSAKFDIKNAVVKDLERFTSIGVGNKTIQSNANLQSGVVYADGEEQKAYKLVGFTEDNQCCELSFEDEEGNEISQLWNLYDMACYGRFMFVTYTNGSWTVFEQSEENFKNRLYSIYESDNGGNCSYLIDTVTKKVYETNVLNKKINNFKANDITGRIVFDDDAIFIMSDIGIYGVRDAIYKLSIENEQLRIEEVINKNLLNYKDSGMLLDRYQNLYLKSGSQESSYIDCFSQYNYILTKQGQIKRLPDNTYLAMGLNKEVYVKDANKKIDANGEMVDTTDNFGLYRYDYIFGCELELVKKENNIEYYAKIRSNEIFCYKITWNYANNTYETEQLSTTSSQQSMTVNNQKYLVQNGRIYFLNDSAISYVDPKTFTLHSLTSDYLYRDFQVGYNGNILFSAIDGDRNSVKGVIYVDDTFDVNVALNNFDIVYVAPIQL